MLASTFTSCSKEDNSVYPDNIVIRNGYSLDSIYAQALEKATGDEITIQLPAGVEVFMKGDIEIEEGYKLNIIGDAANPAKVNMKGGFITSNSIVIKNVQFNINKDVKVPFIKMNTLPEEGLNDKNAFEIDGITLDGIEVLGLKNQLIWTNRQAYFVKAVTINNSNIAIMKYGGEKDKQKNIIDFNGGGFFENLNITNSVIYYADKVKATWQKGNFISTQSAKKPSEISSQEGLTMTVTLTGNTFYKIVEGQTSCNYRENNKDYQFFVVKDNKVVNCDKNGQFIVGIGTGRIDSKLAETNWQVSGNIVNWDGEDICEAENKKCGIEGACIAGKVDVTPFEEPAAE